MRQAASAWRGLRPLRCWPGAVGYVLGYTPPAKLSRNTNRPTMLNLRRTLLASLLAMDRETWGGVAAHLDPPA